MIIPKIDKYMEWISIARGWFNYIYLFFGCVKQKKKEHMNKKCANFTYSSC